MAAAADISLLTTDGLTSSEVDPKKSSNPSFLTPQDVNLALLKSEMSSARNVHQQIRHQRFNRGYHVRLHGQRAIIVNMVVHAMDIHSQCEHQQTEILNAEQQFIVMMTSHDQCNLVDDTHQSRNKYGSYHQVIYPIGKRIRAKMS